MHPIFELFAPATLLAVAATIALAIGLLVAYSAALGIVHLLACFLPLLRRRPLLAHPLPLRLVFALSSLGWLLVVLGHVVDRYLYLSAATAFLLADLLSHFSHVTGSSWLSRLLFAFARLSLLAAPLIIGVLLYLEFSQAPLGPPR